MNTGPRATPPLPRRCPQCRDMWCGEISCRFSGLKHEVAAREAKATGRKPPLSPELVVGVGCCVACIAERALTFAGVIA